MIGAKVRSLDTCAEVRFAPYHDVIASHLQMFAEDVTAFGMSIGVRDEHAAPKRGRIYADDWL
jgi:hypothetical protein